MVEEIMNNLLKEHYILTIMNTEYLQTQLENAFKKFH